MDSHKHVKNNPNHTLRKFETATGLSWETALSFSNGGLPVRLVKLVREKGVQDDKRWDHMRVVEEDKK
jgi:hypothetical protein